MIRAMTAAAVWLIATGAVADTVDAVETAQIPLSMQPELYLHRALFAARAADNAPLAPFTTDGCSGGMSDGWAIAAETLPETFNPGAPAPPWEQCCVTHDRAYHNAGGASTAEQSVLARLDADRALEACVTAEGRLQAPQLAAETGWSEDQIAQGFRIMGALMFQAVRLGGAPCSGLSWRWGYGYPGCQADK